MSWFKNLSVRLKLYCLVGIFGLSFLGFGYSAYRTLELVKVNGPYYARIVQGKDLVADVLPPPAHAARKQGIAVEVSEAMNIDLRSECLQGFHRETSLVVLILKLIHRARIEGSCPGNQAGLIQTA